MGDCTRRSVAQHAPRVDFVVNGLHSKHGATNQVESTTCRYIQAYDESNPVTHKGQNLYVMTMDDLYKWFSLDAATIEFIGHALALHHDEGYMRQPALPTVKRIQLYYQSLTRFEGLKSPYIYPMYGLGELPQVRCARSNTLDACAAAI